MARYTKITNGAITRYKDGEEYVKAEDVPQNIKEALASVNEGVAVDELGDVIDPSTDTDEGSGDDDEIKTNATPPADNADDQGAGDDGEEDEEDEEDGEETLPTPPAPTPAPRRKKDDKQELGFTGFPAKNGKTLSVFSDQVHETVKSVAGYMVPLTNEELVGNAEKGILPKNDAEIIERLKELGKL